MLFGNPLLREVRTFYREEYLIGTFALDLIERRLGIAFPADEAASIALHIVNAEYNTRCVTPLTDKDLRMSLN